MTGAVLWLGGFAVLALAANLKDPLLLALRPWETGGIVALGLAGFALAAIRARRTGRRIPGALVSALWLAAPVVALISEVRFQVQRREILASGPTAQDLGRHFILGYDRVETIEPLVARGLVGGIFVTRRNVAGRSVAAVAAEIAHLQALRGAAGLPPLIVAADQEGGMVSRLSPPLPAQPALASLAVLPLAQRAAAVRGYATAQGRALARLGITVNFAPVADLRVDRPYNPFDRHSLIAQRAIAADPAVVAAVALDYAQALHGEGVTPTLKHFPGLGRVEVDTHYVRARLDTPLAELAAADWLPFRTVLARVPAYLMVGHVSVAAIDAARPASHSKPVIHAVLREGWGFDGVLVTDDLTMGAIHRHGLCTAVVEALNAGVDLLLIAYDHDQYVPAMACALAAQRDGRLDAAMLLHSTRRLDTDQSRRNPG